MADSDLGKACGRLLSRALVLLAQRLRIAFATLVPNGVVRAQNGQSFVCADVPGLSRGRL